MLVRGGEAADAGVDGLRRRRRTTGNGQTDRSETTVPSVSRASFASSKEPHLDLPKVPLEEGEGLNPRISGLRAHNRNHPTFEAKTVRVAGYVSRSSTDR